MRILLASTSSGSRGGGEIFLRYLAQSLAAAGHKVGVWMSEAGQMDLLAKQLDDNGIEVLRTPYTNTYNRRSRSLSQQMPASARKALLEAWEKWSPDVLHLNKQNLEDGPDLYLQAARFPTPSVCTIHITQTQHSLGAVGGRVRDLLSRRRLRAHPMPLSAVSDLRGKELAKFAGRETTTIYNGVPAPPEKELAGWRQSHREKLGWDDQAIGFVAVGRMVAQKRPLEFIRLATQVHQRYPQAKFAWIGDGDLADKWDEATVGCTGWIQRLPWQESTTPWFAAADVFLHTAAFEGLPFAVVEALSHKLPPLLPDSVIQEAKPFIEADIPSSDRPSGWIEDVCDRDFLRQLSDKARQLYGDHFSADAMADSYLALYQTALDQSG